MTQPDNVGRLDAFTRRFGGSPSDCNRFERRAAASQIKRISKKLPKSERPDWMHPKHQQNLSEDERYHLRELNKYYAKGMLGNSVRFVFEPGDGKPPKFLSRQDASIQESSRIFWEAGAAKGSMKKVNAFTRWLEWPGHRRYEEIKFAPGSDDLTTYNLFQGWPVEPIPGDWSLLRHHIRDVICGGKPDQFEWFMTWLAHIFQKPGEKGSVAVVIRGEKGTGKSLVFDFIQKLMPQYFFKEADGKRVTGTFNSHYEHTLLLLMEEAFWAGDQANESILKDLITSSLLPIERKGVDKYMSRNFMRVAMISNEKWVVPAGGRERRYAVFDAASDHIGDLEYFHRIVEQMKGGGLEAMLDDLLKWKPQEGWNILFTPPATSGLREQVVESLTGLDRFMYELLAHGIYECDDCTENAITLDEDKPTEFSMTDLRIAARDYLADHYHGKKAATFDMIQPRVFEWFGATVERKKTKTNNGRWVQFPPLKESRAHVRQTKGIEIKGPFDEGPEPELVTLH